MRYVRKGNYRLAALSLLLGSFFLCGGIGWMLSGTWGGGWMVLIPVMGPLFFLSAAGYIYLLAWEALARFEVTDEYFVKSYPYGVRRLTVRFEDVVGYYEVWSLTLMPFVNKLVVDTADGRVAINRFMGPEYHVILGQLDEHVPERRGRSSFRMGWPWW